MDHIVRRIIRGRTDRNGGLQCGSTKKLTNQLLIRGPKQNQESIHEQTSDNISRLCTRPHHH
jgi:hypothetical protein